MQLALTESHDLDISGGRRKFVTGYAASKQAWKISMRLFRGEWHLDRRAGFPWLQVVFTERPSLLTIRAKMHEMALTIPGIVEVLSVRLEPRAGNNLTGTVEALYSSGDIVRFEAYEPVISVGSV